MQLYQSALKLSYEKKKKNLTKVNERDLENKFGICIRLVQFCNLSLHSIRVPD